jgi:hypothetical protein
MKRPAVEAFKATALEAYGLGSQEEMTFRSRAIVIRKSDSTRETTS